MTDFVRPYLLDNSTPQSNIYMTAFGEVRLVSISKWMQSISKDWVSIIQNPRKPYPRMDEVNKIWDEVVPRIEAYAKAHYELGMETEMVL